MATKSKSEIKRPFSTVLVSEIRAALLFASTDETRFVLYGVQLELREGKQPLLVATNGRQLVAIESEAAQESPGRTESLILSADFLKPFCAFAKTQAASAEVDFHSPKRICLGLKEAKLWLDCEEGAVVEGDYPNWRETIPSGDKEPVPEIGLNAELVSTFAKAAKLLDAEVLIRMNLFKKDGAIEVQIPGKPNFYAIIMPCKADAEAQWQPEFLGLDKASGNVVVKKTGKKLAEGLAPGSTMAAGV